MLWQVRFSNSDEKSHGGNAYSTPVASVSLLSNEITPAASFCLRYDTKLRSGRVCTLASSIWMDCVDPAKPKKIACDDEVEIRFWTSSNFCWSKRKRWVIRKCGLPSSSFMRPSTISVSPSVKWNLAGNSELLRINAPFHWVVHFLATSGSVRAALSNPLRRLDESESESGLRRRTGLRLRDRSTPPGSLGIAWRGGLAS